MPPSQKQTNVSESALAEMRRTNELFDAEVVTRGNMDALDRRQKSTDRGYPPPFVCYRSVLFTVVSS
jgi:hypothetical protein